MFGRPPRDTGLESERNNRVTAAQNLWLLNSSQHQRKIEQCRMIQFPDARDRTPAEIATAMYLGILSRFPTAEELKIAEDYFQIRQSAQAPGDGGPGLGIDEQRRNFFTDTE